MSSHTPTTHSQSSTGNTLTRTAVAAAVALALALAIGGGVAAQSPAPQAAATGAAAIVAPAMPSFADVAERVSPAVVNVTVIAEAATTNLMPRQHPGLPEGAPLDEFFKHFFDQPNMPGRQRAEGAGSGFVIDASGLVVTNNHVVEGANEITVTLNDGSKHQAQVVGRDDKTDLALLKIDAGRTLPFVDLADASATRVGDWVLAVGNPFGLGGSVSAGIVSARGRDINAGPYDDYLQIDAPINRGNSGGPLFDVYGRVIGVNTAIYSPTGGNVGIGFAIPAETVKKVVADLRQDGRVSRGWLGVQIQPVTEDIAGALGLTGTDGVLIADILPDGPAAGTELQPGDVILKAGDQPIKDYKDLPKLIADTKAGTRLNLELVRGGKPLSVTVTIGAMPGSETLAKNEVQPAATQDETKLGLYLVSVTPELRQEKGLRPASNGVYVARVQPGSPAAEAGVESGSLISMVGGQPVDSPAQVYEAVRAAVAAKRSAVMLRIEKDGRPMFIAVPLAA